VKTPNLEYANKGGFLWPPIADALDTFLRRQLMGADPFERIWRLIHVWEATEITLALASLALLQLDEQKKEIFRRQREFFYGKSWDPVTESFKEIHGAVDGAIDQWINILDELSKANDLTGRFLPSLQAFLKSKAVNVGPLVKSWARTCDVPSDYQEQGIVEVRVAMRYINSFRNRLAHVPFPHDPLAEVSEALETATEQLFVIEPVPTSHEKAGASSPLTGALRIGSCFLHGGSLESVNVTENTSVSFVFPCQKKEPAEVWPAVVLVHIDPMMRPHVLTRVKGLDVCEYTRFRAEANAVLVVPEAGIANHIPTPEKKEYLVSEPSSEKPPIQEHEITLPEALESIRSGDFETGIAFFSNLVEQRPEYHVGWLRLGHAKREKAARIVATAPQYARQLLTEALENLATASEHIDPSYKALAHYERSKTYYRLARLAENDDGFMIRARDEASAASNISTERKYQTWMEHLSTYGRANDQSPLTTKVKTDEQIIDTEK